MSLPSSLRMAKKRARRNRLRKIRRADLTKKREASKIRNKRISKMMIEGRREQLARRRQELGYVNQLEQDLVGNEH